MYILLVLLYTCIWIVNILIKINIIKTLKENTLRFHSGLHNYMHILQCKKISSHFHNRIFDIGAKIT